MSSRSISSLVRWSIPRFSLIYKSRFHTTTSLIPRTLILRNLISQPCCAISVKSASSKSVGSENDKYLRAYEIFLLVVESVAAERNMVITSVMAEGNMTNMLPKDLQFEIIDNPESITLKKVYGGEQIEAIASMDNEHRIKLSVAIERKVGHTLKFCCNLTSNDFEIESMSFSDQCKFDLTFDKKYRSVFQEYLAARGFEKSLYDYVHCRMEQKGFALQSLKEFSEKDVPTSEICMLIEKDL